MSRLAALKAATSLGDVAQLLGFKPKALAYVLYKQPAANKYSTFEVPKRTGGMRTIKAPVDALKLLQRKLSDLLQDCVDEIDAARNRKEHVAHGFVRRRSIVTNAKRHRARRWVFNLDLEDFFPSINFGRVRGFFMKSRDFALHEDVATVIAQISCHANSLPQGSPCSPVISNLIAHLLDVRLLRLATNAGCTYSRYADDLTFSTNKSTFPRDVVVPAGPDGEGAHQWLPSAKLGREITRAGFRINVKKTSLMYRRSRQTVTGLVVNKQIGVRLEYRRNARAMVHNLVRTGQFDVLGIVHKNGAATLERRPGTLHELHGMLGFIDSVDVYNETHTGQHRSEGRSSRAKVYRQFLFYRNFYAAAAPVIICEGETDNIYLTHAIRSLAGDFPELAEIRPDGKIVLKVRLYKFPHSGTARLLDLTGGGSSVLSKFIAAYKQEIVRFTAPGPAYPVIVLYDNDDGGKAIQNTIKRVSKSSPAGTERFVKVVKNLYAVPTPLPAGASKSKIEDFFGASVKATVVDGKTFNEENNFDDEMHYGKKVFAHKVVRRRADVIDFTGFRPLLGNMVAAIKAHQADEPPPKPAAANVPLLTPQPGDTSSGTAGAAPGT